ncbi:LSU ribosomal protein L24P [Ferrithrix thermotolerans DSM 19514]|jgi:large subunit ribosomal protein L24|uniref:Large ribosomal subunit protein uL24 n=1 Tax=Ferrithrix thermotolerans DSM 19514 TaxID=1121881 RepID=A0A1M4ST64_9ACTN|nr:50S ribosomal protein L24 [Ferrithrix thermotolerans]SHE35332.1 LSU ribosomal protein L24P [Ferrithrix thermotolerans DSM 19514]
MKIKKGDKVRIIAGKDRGQEGEVVRVLPKESRVVVAGVNVAKRHTKPTSATTQGGIIDKAMPMHVSNVAMLCSKCGPTRVGYSMDADGKKSRVCAKCGAEL